MRISRAVLLVIVLSLTWASGGFAQTQDPREIQARKDCLTGKYEAGAALLAELFAETPNPNFVYNQARCYEQNARPDEAIQHFREFLRIARDLSAEEKKDVESHIAECRALKAEQEQQRASTAGAAVLPAPPVAPTTGVATPPAPLVPPAPGVAAPAAPAVAPAAGPAVTPATAAPAVTLALAPPVAAPAKSASPPTVAAATVPAPSPASGSSSLRTWAIVIGSVGVVAIGAGVAFSVLTKNTQQEVESDASKDVYNPSKDANGRRYATLQWVGYGVGAAGLLTAAIVSVVGSSKPQPSGGRSVAVVPAVGPGQGGVLLQGSF